jgi:signal transduction histidine kinase
MQERVRQVGGSLEVESKPGSGVEIRAVFANCYRSAHGNPRLRIA